MTPIQVVAVCLRFLAIVWLLYALNNAYGTFSYLRLQPGQSIAGRLVWFQVAMQLATCAVLWFFPVTVASKLLPSYTKPPDPQNPPHWNEWQTLGVICIGLWTLSRAIPDLVYWVTFIGMAFESDMPFGELAPEHKAGLLTTLAEIAIGFWLVLGAKGTAAVVFKIRTAGIAK